MTTAELIQRLQQYPPDTRVVVSGYEGGADDVTMIRPIRLDIDYSDKEWEGRHSIRRSSEEGSTPAIYIHGRHAPD